MTLVQIIEQIRTKVDDTGASSVALTAFINEGQDMLCEVYDIDARTELQALPDGSFKLPADMKEPVRLVDSEGNTIYKYDIFDGKLTIEEGQVLGPVTLYYVRFPKELSGSSVPEIPKLFHRYLVDYGVWQFKIMDEDADTAESDECKRRFFAGREELRGYNLRRRGHRDLQWQVVRRG